MVGHAIKAYQKACTTLALQKAVVLQKVSSDGAISTCLMDETGKLLPTALKMALNANPPSSKHFISNLALQTSNYYIKDGKPGYALEAAVFIAVDQRKDFYKRMDLLLNILIYYRKLKTFQNYIGS